MIKIICQALLICGAVLTASAQIGMDLTLNRTNYIQFEPIYACVTLRNDTARPLLFGKNPKLQGYILFEVTDQRGNIVPKRPGMELSVRGLVLEPGQIKRMIVPINRYYQLDRTGVYRVHAYVSHSMLPSEYKTVDLKFNVEPGISVWKQTVGVPDLNPQGDPNAVSVERTYNIRSITEGATKAYYLVIEDSKKIYSVIRIGKAVGYERFSVQVDMLSRIHLLMPLSPKVFQYLAFSVDGKPVANQYRKISSTIPMLFRNPDTGIVTLVGGETARAGVDFADPSAGLVKAADLLSEEDAAATGNSAPPPKAPAAPGLVDLGKDL
ncbi:hypothetical protein [uncultured Victivallis sp.]|uniref:hypothetical protein n=1 Tax=uncultured Victivallis sp. TaxID=354118 RepID=UPI0025EEAE81|nr:hypothetical protein [uncultured Victivallis sp.]